MIGGYSDDMTESLRKLAVMISMRLNTSVSELQNMPMEEILNLSSDIAEIDERRKRE